MAEKKATPKKKEEKVEIKPVPLGEKKPDSVGLPPIGTRYRALAEQGDNVLVEWVKGLEEYQSLVMSHISRKALVAAILIHEFGGVEYAKFRLEDDQERK